jgi:hypothetical protein
LLHSLSSWQLGVLANVSVPSGEEKKGNLKLSASLPPKGLGPDCLFLL